LGEKRSFRTFRSRESAISAVKYVQYDPFGIVSAAPSYAPAAVGFGVMKTDPSALSAISLFAGENCGQPCCRPSSSEVRNEELGT